MSSPTTRAAPLGAPSGPVPLATTASAQTAKAALRRLALARLEPTPENYARAYNEELGIAPRPLLTQRSQALIERMAAALLADDAQRAALVDAFARGQSALAERLLDAAAAQQAGQAQAVAALMRTLVRGLERADRHWTLARKKESLRTVLDGSRGDMPRLLQRLAQLLASWERDGPVPAVTEPDVAAAPQEPTPSRPAHDGFTIAELLGGALRRALPVDDEPARALDGALATALAELASGHAGAAEALQRHAAAAERLLQRRHVLHGQLHALCGELTGALTEVAEDESWARGQCEAMRARLAEGASGRGLRSVRALLDHTRERQRGLRAERERARDALKGLIHEMLQQVGELGTHTGRFTDNVARYAEVIDHADSLESLAGAVREMVAESRTVQGLVSAARQRLNDEHARATDLSQRVKSLEDELRHLSDEVSTDPLTQVANRRGLLRAFDAERARAERGGEPLAVGLLDVDDFKRLNDRLGHAAGDAALKSLAARVQGLLRPSDAVARYGGEEFVVLLPGTPLDDARQVLTRMQRATTEALFLHDSAPVFVTFSAGVTLYRPGERLEEALERADDALYEAKRAGKNRTCMA